jgi:hypothetical protein
MQNTDYKFYNSTYDLYRDEYTTMIITFGIIMVIFLSCLSIRIYYVHMQL